MKTSCYCAIFLLFLQIAAIGQSTNSKVNEVGISLNGSNIGFRYKTGNQSSLLRLTLLSLTGHSSWQNDNPSEVNRNNSQGLGINIGFEKRKEIIENISFYYGADLLSSYFRSVGRFNSSSTDKYWNFSPGVGFVIGFDYTPASRIRVSGEVMPSITYSYLKDSSTSGGTTNTYRTSQLDYGLKNSGISLTLAYILGKRD